MFALTLGYSVVEKVVDSRYRYNTDTILIWYRYSTHTIPIWYLYDTHTIPIQYLFDTDAIPIQYLYDTHTIPIRYPYDTHTIPIRYPYDISRCQPWHRRLNGIGARSQSSNRAALSSAAIGHQISQWLVCPKAIANPCGYNETMRYMLHILNLIFN